MKTIALIVAAGAGLRMGGGPPKAFRPLAGRPLLLHSIERFARHPSVNAVAAVVPHGMVEKTRQLCAPFPRVIAVTEGGERRLDSVRRGFDNVRAGCQDEDIVLVHDAARPLTPSDLVTAVVEAAQRTGAAVPGITPSDTVREMAPDPGGGLPLTARRLDRDRLVLVQTPQGFRAGLLATALERAAAGSLPADVTDDAALVELLGHPVTIVEGSTVNFKITRPLDLKMAESWLA
jgi:2-C-methyl-D-erythritol 4-phosphate cytidylyltransferase